MADQKGYGPPPPYIAEGPYRPQPLQGPPVGMPQPQYMPHAGGHSYPGGHVAQNYGPPAQYHGRQMAMGMMVEETVVTTEQVHVTQPAVTPVAAVYVQDPPRDYTVPAFLACFFCCWPIGLVAIMKAMQARNEAASGNMTAAHTSANSARNLTTASVVCGIVIIILIIVLVTTTGS